MLRWQGGEWIPIPAFLAHLRSFQLYICPLASCDHSSTRPDAIATHGLGFPFSVGRPSCTGGVRQLIALVRSRKPGAVVIARDNDEPGSRGAEALARALILHCRDLRVAAPPASFKDLRQWITAGACRRDLEQLVHAAEAQRLVLSFSTRGNL